MGAAAVRREPPHVIFIGLDGAGKSAIICRICDACDAPDTEQVQPPPSALAQICKCGLR
jgi:hypothetical protein